MLEPLVDKIASEQSAEVKLQLLTATMKLFFKKPPECQDMLGRLLKFCVGEFHSLVQLRKNIQQTPQSIFSSSCIDNPQSTLRAKNFGQFKMEANWQ